MARLDPEAAARLQALLEKSDEELGRWVAGINRPAIEEAACQAVGIKSFAITGRNALVELAGVHAARTLVDLLTDGLLIDAVRVHRAVAEPLAAWLAMRGEYERAGRTLKYGLRPSYVRHLDEKLRLAKSAETKIKRRNKKMIRWYLVGKGIRERERGVRMNNSVLAGRIKQHPSCARDSVTSIRLAVPNIGLDAASWPDTVKPRPRKKTNRKFSTRATLRK